jgi:hypothetical protein
MPKTLVIDLVGRICLVKDRKVYGEQKKPEPREEENKGLWAIFLSVREGEQVKVPHKEPLKLREHSPLLSVPLSMVKTQKVADEARLACATFVKPLNSNRGLADSMGIWNLVGDMRFDNVKEQAGILRIRDLANLNAIVANTGKAAPFGRDILANPPIPAVAARLWCPSLPK